MKSLLKTTLSLVGFLCLSQLALGQTVGQGAWMIGGSAALDITKDKNADESETTILFNPNLGYFIADDLAIGLGVFVYNFPIFDETETIFNLGPFVRYYVADPIFIQANVNLELNDGGGTSFGAAVGYSWFLNNGVAIEPALYFQSYNNDGDALDFTSFGLNIGIQAFAHHDHGMPR